jgi:hypothetical protein
MEEFNAQAYWRKQLDAIPWKFHRSVSLQQKPMRKDLIIEQQQTQIQQLQSIIANGNIHTAELERRLYEVRGAVATLKQARRTAKNTYQASATEVAMATPIMDAPTSYTQEQLRTVRQQALVSFIEEETDNLLSNIFNVIDGKDGSRSPTHTMARYS